MFRSQNFLAQEKRVHKDVQRGTDEYRSAVLSLVARHLNQLPEEMANEVFDYAFQKDSEAGTPATTIADMIDLLWMQYDDQNDPLDENDWRFIRDLTDQFAIELEMTLVQYIMERVVDHKAI